MSDKISFLESELSIFIIISLYYLPQYICAREVFVFCIVQILGVARFRTVTVRSPVPNTPGNNTSNTKVTHTKSVPNTWNSVKPNTLPAPNFIRLLHTHQMCVPLLLQHTYKYNQCGVRPHLNSRVQGVWPAKANK